MTRDTNRYPIFAADWWPDTVHVIPEPCDEPTPDTALADTPCGLCGERIGYGQRFHDDPEHGPTHRDCWLERYESRPEAYGSTFADQAAERIEAGR